MLIRRLIDRHLRLSDVDKVFGTLQMNITVKLNEERDQYVKTLSSEFSCYIDIDIHFSRACPL